MNIHIPTPLRAYTEKQPTVSVPGNTIAEVLAALVAAYPALQQHLFTAEGKLRSFVNVYLNDEDVRWLPQKEDTTVNPGDELSIIPSIAGGAAPRHPASAPAPTHP
ncbi:MAG: ubiquitin-like small modifier protein 1 [Acidobacteriaceae bacterium]